MTLPGSAADRTRFGAPLDLEARVRYYECDPMGVVHHSVYPVWMEMARTEMLRRAGTPYAALEASGAYFVVARMGLRYRRPARYDDVLRVHVWVSDLTRAKIDHAYEIFRGDELLVTAETTLACVDRDGRLRSIPDGITN